MSFDYLRIINYIGKANPQIMDKIKEYLKRHFGL